MAKKPNYLSLYSGAGGMDLGFHSVGFEGIFANDFDRDAVNTFNSLMPKEIAVHADVRSLDFSIFDNVDVVIGGPPCQGFSVAGKMQADDPRSSHIWEFLKVVAETSPRVFVMENVKSLGTNPRWRQLRENLKLSARAIGYEVQLWNLVASDYGVPQKRERMFLIGSRVGKLDLPKKMSRVSTSRDALTSLPKFGDPGNDTLVTAQIKLTLKPILRKSPFAGMLFNGAGRPINLDQPSQTVPASIGGNKTPIVDQYWLEGGTNRWLLEHHARLMRGETPSPSIKVPDHIRRITAEEASVLQGFPIGMNWSGSRSSVFRQIGNAVPPELARAVAVSVKKALESSSDNVKKPPMRFTAQEIIEMGTSQLIFDL